MATDKTRLYEAFDEEAKDVDVADLMQQMMESYNQEKGYTPTPADEVRIRKMMLARKYIEREADRLTLLREAVLEDWTARINKKLEEAKSIEEFIEDWIKNHNKGAKLSLDVGTATLRRTGPKVKVADAEKAKAFLQEHGQLQAYLKPAPLDTTLLQTAYMNQFATMVETEANRRIEAEVEASDKKKITKKREAQIKSEVELELTEGYFTQLPDFLEYVPEKKALSITMK